MLVLGKKLAVLHPINYISKNYTKGETMTTLQQAFRTVCVPQTDWLNMPIPREYVNQEVEIIVLPMWKKSEPNYNAETLAAMQETLDIMDGKTKVKSYATVAEMNADIDAEDDD